MTELSLSKPRRPETHTSQTVVEKNDTKKFLLERAFWHRKDGNAVILRFQKPLQTVVEDAEPLLLTLVPPRVLHDLVSDGEGSVRTQPLRVCRRV